ncbi:fatty-acyl-CoA synthetase [Amycolatopsis mediterranei S699]|uniref:Fatty-acyl-CoA synthetase n=3 Tax=Amycolatopsis mediterranei TaxID=33910 RepID=A0A0H3D8C7_AMYMU|nr:class I adenylate-forming enzyme family protein [Amycolatopsis mediterranei]ADJ45789.1 fatty-acyl-CoA synthetase [Amycolatopsis mediterranei U32]AEK42570.1 fatty-acyl-CoA synthetase [Amycolatopsis mediterranei S699]AFO77500.1 fatty-acyl-CoA synthetase [Amycolatopsis mediterranei S699]AGT84628.1 fatty-acyl-CoA synthetase [Amycolatopsis mediterranei RB]KDO05325.1 fatty-acyl-CoA synthase [Amycolatopsis mediterranei]
MNDFVTRFLSTAGQRPGDVAVIDPDGRTTTFGELRRLALEVGAGLRAEGLEPGDGVLFAVRNSATALGLFLGALQAGAVLVSADTAVGPALVSARLRACRPRWLIAESLFYTTSVIGPARTFCRRRGWPVPDLRQPIGDPGIRHVHIGRRLPGVPRAALALKDLLGRAPGTAPERDPDAPALIVFTSGTTEQPKGVVHSLRSLTAAVMMLGEHLPFAPGDVMHADGIMAGLPALLGGARLSLPKPSAPPGRFARDLVDRRVTHAYGVPVHLAEVFGVFPHWPEHVRHLVMGSAPAAPAVLRQAMAAVPAGQVLSIYAMTEAIPLAVARAEDKLAHIERGLPGDLLGTPSPGVSVRIAGDGELLVSAPNACLGYLGAPPLTELATGDLARLDGAGRIVMTGRKKDMLIRGSYNIYPGLYEPSIALLAGVREAAMVGTPDPLTGDESVVLAVVADGADTDPARLVRRLRRQLPELIDAEAVPDRIVVLPELPRSGRSRKLDRSRLRELMTASRP